MPIAHRTGEANPRFRPPRSAYLHVPFCRHRCVYCNFTLVAQRDDLIPAYLDALERELVRLESPHTMDTLFLGGGTPSHLNVKDLARLLGLLREWLPLNANGEFTMEANPNDLCDETLSLLANAGVTRVSLGAQSFNADKLEFLERDHGQVDIEHSANLVINAGLSVSLDLIFGVPGESAQQWGEDLQIAVALGTAHVSTYGLTIERGSRLWSLANRGEVSVVAEAHEARLYDLAIEHLTRSGYRHYEVSNFAQPGQQCRHNLNYWNGGTYLAFGPGAASHVDGRRAVNHRSTTTYLRRVLSGESPVAESESLSPREAAQERLVFGLRQLAGIDCAQFRQETGFTVEQLGGECLAQLLERGLLRQNKNMLRVTKAGLFVCDAIASSLLGASPFPPPQVIRG